MRITNEYFQKNQDGLIDFNIFDNDNFGWAGLYQEEKAFELAVKQGYVMEFNNFLATSNPISDAIKKRIQQMFQFDKGWAFWYAEQIYLKFRIPHGPQNMGNCVAYSAFLVLCYLMLQEILVIGDNEEFYYPFIPYLYGAGRVYEGGNRLGGDGSNGIWQINACMKHGVLPSDLSGIPDGAPQCSSSIGRTWGRSKSTLDQWRPKALPYKIRATTRCTSAEDVKKMIVDYQYPVTHASSAWFRRSGYDSKYELTLWTLGGRAAHQTFTEACFEIKGQWFFYIGNQWGNNYHGNPGRGFPLGGFVVPFETYDRFIKTSACYAYQDFGGRERQKPDFKIM
jgi:hypothetical protein